MVCTGCINILHRTLGGLYNQAVHQGVTQDLGSCVKGADKTAPDQPALITRVLKSRAHMHHKSSVFTVLSFYAVDKKFTTENQLTRFRKV